MKIKAVCAVAVVLLSTTIRPAAGVVTEVHPESAEVQTGLTYEVEGEDWAHDFANLLK